MRRVIVLGAGKIGGAICDLLGGSGDWQVTVADRQKEFLSLVPEDRARRELVDVSDSASLTAIVDGNEYVVSALPFFLNPTVAQVCKQVGAHYFDLTEDVATTRAVRDIADGADVAFVPQCGLAPGFISTAAYDLTRRFDRLREVRMRVGALPQFPVDALKYNLTWSTDGLINEYCNPCEAIRDGRITEMLPLEGLESFSLDGVDYEAFNTSGGLGSLAETYGDRVKTMNYKTIRYPGHCEQMRLLMYGLKLNDDRDTLKRILEKSVPQTLQDVVIIYAAVTGMQDGEFREENYVNKVYPQVVAGRLWSAIQITTAAGICAIIDIVLSDPDNYHGFVAQEQFSLADVLENRFGRYFAHGGDNRESAAMIARGETGHQRSSAGG